MATDSSNIGNPADQERLADIKKNIEKWFDFFGDNIDLSKENKRFLWGDQWEQHIADEYLSLGKVTLTFNILAPYQRRLSAEVRASTPALEVVPEGERTQSSEQTAKIIESVIRKIFLSSNAKRSFQIGFDNASGGGYGALGYKNKFTDVNSFKQEIDVFPIPEPERCGFDPAAKEPTKCDGDYSFYVNTMSNKEFEKQFGFKPPTASNNAIFLENQFAWYDTDNVSVVDYYEKEYFSVPVVKMANGSTVKAKELRDVEKFLDENPEMDNPQIRAEIKVVDKRTATDYKIMNYIVMSDRILEKKKWGGKELRHVFVDGNSYFQEGEQFIQAFIKDAIDPQKFHNYVKSETVQNIKDSTKEDYIGTVANIEGNEKQWKDKRRRKGILLAKPDPITSQLPIKQPPSQINPQLLALGLEGDENVKSGLGVFDSNQGASSTDLSGKAENIRVNQGNLSSFIYIDNLNQAIEQVGKGVLSLFQAINTDTDTVQGVKEDGSQLTSQVNVPVFGGQVLNNISDGKFKVSIQASSSFAAQRDAEYQRILSYAQAFPVMQNTVQDLAAKKLNSDISTDIVARAELTLPPQIQAQNKDNPQLAQQAQKQMAQQQQQQQQQQQMAQMLVQMKATDDHIRALADQMGGMANIMNAQTNQSEAKTKGVIETIKIVAEDERTKEEAQRDFLKASAVQPSNIAQFGLPSQG